MNTQRTQTALLDSREALTTYLDSLFGNAFAVETPDEAEPAPTPLASVVTKTAEVLPAVVAETPALPNATPMPTQPLACAILKLGELRLALPLVELHGIRRQADRLTRLPGLPEWVLGVHVYASGRVQVIDTAKVLGRASNDFEYRQLHTVVVAAGRWALACNGVEKTMTIGPEDVRWRHHRDDDPWFAGVVAKELCSYIDVPELVRWLEAELAPTVRR
jgi:purine-binding chemotaxis protein CheW